MVITEIKNDFATVRIHDEFYRKETQQTMSEINRIISQAYRRRLSETPAFPLVNNPNQRVEH